MGSHFSQCFATLQTIAPGDKCYALAIRQQATYRPVALKHKGKKMQAYGISHGSIWPDAYWTTVGNFLEGRYSLNGDIDIVENDENFRRLVVFTREMLENGAVTVEGENPSHDLPYNFPAFVKENCPALAKYLKKPFGTVLSKEEKSTIFAEMTSGWQYTDDVAFEHRVFFMDYRGNPRPLQFTLLHAKFYDAMLENLDAEYTPEALVNRVLDVLDTQKVEYPEEKFATPAMRQLLRWVGQSAIEKVVRQLGEFNSIEYHEENLGFGDFALQYMFGELDRKQIQKILAPVMKDRLVVRMLEEHEIKISPKSIRYEDTKNHFGKDYAAMLSKVSEAVTKSRKRAPKY